MAEEGGTTGTVEPQGTGGTGEGQVPQGTTPPRDDTDWKSMSRKHEREKKEALERERKLQEKLEKIEEQSKSDTDRALDKARKEARKEAESEFEKERRSDRLQVAVAKRARELADVDDVVLNLERMGTDDLFDENGKVDSEALRSTLDGLLEQKPHLRASGVGKPQGDVGGGQGEGATGTSMNDLLRSDTGGTLRL